MENRLSPKPSSLKLHKALHDLHPQDRDHRFADAKTNVELKLPATGEALSLVLGGDHDAAKLIGQRILPSSTLDLLKRVDAGASLFPIHTLSQDPTVSPRVADTTIGEKARHIESTIESGNQPDMHALFDIAVAGTDAERAIIRRAFVSPHARETNQDLTLSLIPRILSEANDAWETYTKRRITMIETLPEWGKCLLESEASARWRTMNLRSKSMNQFARRVNGCVEDQFNVITVGLLKDADCPDTLLGVNVNRQHLLTYFHASTIIQEFTKHVQMQLSSIGRDMLRKIADREIRFEERNLASPTPIGRHYRLVALREFKTMICIQLVEDMCVHFRLPLSDEGKTALVSRIPEFTSMPKMHRLASLVTFIEEQRSAGRSEDELQDLSLKWILGTLAVPEKEKAEVPIVVADKAYTAPVYVEHRSNTPIIRAALEVHRQLSGETLRRYARVLGKLTADSDTLFQQTLEGIEGGMPLDAMILALRDKRPLTVLSPVRSTTSPVVSQPRSSAETAYLLSLVTEQKQLDQVTYTPRARKEMTNNGTTRHIVEDLVEELVNQPDRVDTKKIKGIETFNVWELRDHRRGIRVYYTRPINGHILVLDIGDKDQQQRDIMALSDYCYNQIPTFRPSNGG